MGGKLFLLLEHIIIYKKCYSIMIFFANSWNFKLFDFLYDFICIFCLTVYKRPFNSRLHLWQHAPLLILELKCDNKPQSTPIKTVTIDYYLKNQRKSNNPWQRSSDVLSSILHSQICFAETNLFIYLSQVRQNNISHNACKRDGNSGSYHWSFDTSSQPSQINLWAWHWSKTMWNSILLNVRGSECCSS